MIHVQNNPCKLTLVWHTERKEMENMGSVYDARLHIFDSFQTFETDEEMQIAIAAKKTEGYSLIGL